MGDVPVHDVNHEIIGGIAIAALSQENKIPRPVEARAGKSLAGDQKMGSDQNETYDQRPRQKLKNRACW
jgi:hypothetical protein